VFECHCENGMSTLSVLGGCFDRSFISTKNWGDARRFIRVLTVAKINAGFIFFRSIPERAWSHADIRRRRLIACKQSFGWGPLESRSSHLNTWRGPISIGFPLGGDRANEDFSKAGSQALERNDLAAGSVQVEGRFSGGSWGWVGLTWNKFKAIYILSINVLDGSSRCTMMHFFFVAWNLSFLFPQLQDTPGFSVDWCLEYAFE